MIENFQIIENFFGYAPNFHDSEIKGIQFDINRAFLELTFYMFEVTSDIDEKGNYKIQKQCLAKLNFEKISEIELDNLGIQNVIFDLLFTKVAEGIKTFIESSCGLNGHIVSSKVSVSDLKILDY